MNNRIYAFTKWNQAQPIDPDLTAKLLGRGVAVSPIVTVEPRRRKFHKAITLSMPAPKAHSQGMINQYSGNAPTLRLLCSITGKHTFNYFLKLTNKIPIKFTYIHTYTYIFNYSTIVKIRMVAYWIISLPPVYVEF